MKDDIRSGTMALQIKWVAEMLKQTNCGWTNWPTLPSVAFHYDDEQKQEGKKYTAI